MSTNRRWALIALAAGGLLAAGAAQAQDYNPYRRPPPPYGYDGPPPGPRGYYRREREFSRMCVTSRGTCEAAPGPIGISCRCNIPGFGKKRGSLE